jgi:hypothetical protein
LKMCFLRNSGHFRPERWQQGVTDVGCTSVNFSMLYDRACTYVCMPNPWVRIAYHQLKGLFSANKWRNDGCAELACRAWYTLWVIACLDCRSPYWN